MTDDFAADLLDMADRLVADAKPGEQIEVVLNRGSSTSVKVYNGEVESLTSADGSAAGIRVIAEGRVGFAHCGTTDEAVLRETLAEARDNLRFAEPDEFNGLATPDGVPMVDQDQWSPSVLEFPVESKIDLALELEAKVLSGDPRIRSARSTSYGDGWGEGVIVTTTGIRLADRSTSVSIGTQPLSESDGETQIGFGYGVWQEPSDVDVSNVAAEAVERAVKLLGATKPASGRMSILLEPRLTMTLLGVVSGMLAGDTVVRGRSPFAERLGDQIASPLLTLTDDPTRSESLAASSFDGEGLACRANPLLVDGVLDRFLYDSYTARRVKGTSTASAVRGARSLPGVSAQLLVMAPGEGTFDEIVASMDHGLCVNSFSGLHSGVNAVSGDFSVGADGIMIRDGGLAEPVREITVASTIQRLLQSIVRIGGDFEWLPSGDGSVSMVIEDVSISGT
ncbi:MAG: TldD/PmbA family protein [Microthrixaceae bacterium]